MTDFKELFDGRDVEIRCQDYFDKVVEFAKKTNRIDQLKEQLQRAALKTYFGKPAKTMIFKDFAPYSFEFTIQYQDADGEWKFGMNGGIIFHGSHDNGGDGGAPTYSVNLTPQDGWSVHT